MLRVTSQDRGESICGPPLQRRAPIRASDPEAARAESSQPPTPATIRVKSTCCRVAPATRAAILTRCPALTPRRGPRSRVPPLRRRRLTQNLTRRRRGERLVTRNQPDSGGELPVQRHPSQPQAPDSVRPANPKMTRPSGVWRPRRVAALAARARRHRRERLGSSRTGATGAATVNINLKGPAVSAP